MLMLAQAEAECRARGIEVVNPQRQTPYVEGKVWRDYMKEDIVLMMGCDVIFLLKGWRRSKGARLERLIAKVLGYIIWEEK